MKRNVKLFLIAVLVDFALLAIGLCADICWSSNHPVENGFHMPVFITIAACVAFLFSLVVAVVIVFRIIRGFFRR